MEHQLCEQVCAIAASAAAASMSAVDSLPLADVMVVLLNFEPLRTQIRHVNPTHPKATEKTGYGCSENRAQHSYKQAPSKPRRASSAV